MTGFNATYNTTSSSSSSGGTEDRQEYSSTMPTGWTAATAVPTRTTFIFFHVFVGSTPKADTELAAKLQHYHLCTLLVIGAVGVLIVTSIFICIVCKNPPSWMHRSRSQKHTVKHVKVVYEKTISTSYTGHNLDVALMQSGMVGLPPGGVDHSSMEGVLSYGVMPRLVTVTENKIPLHPRSTSISSISVESEVLDTILENIDKGSIEDNEEEDEEDTGFMRQNFRRPTAYSDSIGALPMSGLTPEVSYMSGRI